MERREVALLIIRAEVSDDPRDPLRARVTWRTRLDAPDTEHVAFAAARSDLHDLLDQWLDATFGVDLRGP